MLGSNYQKSDNKLFILKIKNKIPNAEGKDQPMMPHVFQIIEKNAEDKWVPTRTETQFSGDLKNIEFDKGEWDGKEYHVIKLLFEDAEKKEVYLMDCRCNSDFRNIANSIMALDPADMTGLTLKHYAKFSEKAQKNFSNVAMFRDGALVKGKHAWDTMPKVKKVKFKGQEMSDTEELDEWTITKLKEFADKIPKQNQVPQPQVESEPEVGQEDSNVDF